MAYADSSDNEEYLLWNQPPDRSTCPDEPSYVWVEHSHGVECIRYFASDDLHDVHTVIVEFYGDRINFMDTPPGDIPRNTAHDQVRHAKQQAMIANTPVVIIARPGTFGSSGDHSARRQEKEFHSINSAIDAIKQRYSIERFTLLGQSGGATAAAAILTMGRTDITCLVLTSGAYSLLERAHRIRLQNNRPTNPDRDTTGLRNPYDPINHIEGIDQNSETSIYILGNRNDRNTFFDLQENFWQQLVDAGHDAFIEEHQAIPPMHHRLEGDVGISKASECSIP